MITSSSRFGKPGFVSYVLVFTTGTILTLLMVFTYRQAMATRDIQAKVQLRTDYSEKEDAILRSIVAITPNRAIRAMQSGSSSSATVSNPLRWQDIFSEAVDLANARTSVRADVLTSLGVQSPVVANSGDSVLNVSNRIFDEITGDSSSYKTSYISAGINRSLGTGFPVPLQTGNSTTSTYDITYPIISRDKVYGSLAQGGVGLPVSTYPDFNLLKYPEINFGYARPGEDFVAKRNWWAFSLDLADHDDDKTDAVRVPRDFVLSIYEIPSQLAISASSFMSLGEFASGDAWQNVTIAGGVYAGKAEVEGETALPALSSRRGMTLSGDTTIGGESFANNPFTPGVREAYQVTQGEFFPVSLASESGRVAFVPINRGADFFDRFAHSTESSTISPTTWNDYSIGALQCAMRLDVTKVVSSTNKTPAELTFSYIKGGVRKTDTIPLTTASSGSTKNLPPGYLFACNENQSYNFGTSVVDVAYGLNGAWAYQTGVTGSVTFNNARFGDPLVGTVKSGYFRPSYSHEIKQLPSGKTCIAIYPQRIAKLLASLNADSTAVNNSLAVNVDYSNIGPTYPTKPSIPCTDLDYGVILQECTDLTSFTKGFSLVTNLRTYIGDDFNVVAATPPSGYTPVGEYYPPCSLFAPEKRYGVEVDPFAVSMSGQVGSLASEDSSTPIRPLDSKNSSGVAMDASRIRVNLRPIVHPSELPPIVMMNWLVVLEELRKEYVNY